MSDVQFLRLLMLLPLAVPAAAFGLIRIGPELPELVGGVAVYLSYSGLFGGGPYCLFLAGSILALRQATAQKHLRFFLLAPFAFIPVFMLSFIVLAVVEGGIDSLPNDSWVSFVGFYSAMILVLGYLYVIAAWGLYKLAERRSWIAPAA